MWSALMATGKVTPAGLGARDSLRLEMGMALYGNDINDTVTPLEGNLAWLVKLKKGDFVGKAALEKQKADGIPKKLIGFTLPEKNYPRHGYPGVFQRSTEWRGDERNGQPDTRHTDRNGVSPHGGGERGDAVRGGDSRQSECRPPS